MNKWLIISICLYYSFILPLHAQNDLSGTYYSASGTKIEIFGDRFNYIEHQHYCPVWHNDTLAKCSFKWVDSNFIELNSTSPNNIELNGLIINQFQDSQINDSIKVSFQIPYNRNLKIEIFSDGLNTFSFIYSKIDREVMIPNNVKKISFQIIPESISPHTPDFRHYGIIGFNSFLEYPINSNINHISIEIPAMDDSYFEKYYIKGDYAMIFGDTIIWKGIRYKKE